MLTDFFTSLFHLSAEMAPWLLIGFLIAGLLKVYVKPARIEKHLGKNTFKSVLYGALLGVPLPLCSCGVIPTGISLRNNGASDGATVSFLISTPQTGVDSIMVTWSLLGWPFALIRPIIAFLTGITGGWLVNKFNPNKHIRVQAMTTGNSKEKSSSNKLKELLHYAYIEFLDDIVKWLVIGLVLASLIDMLIPASLFSHYLSNPWLEMAVVLLLSVPLYICATGSVPLAAVLLMKGLSPGAAFVLLMAGPATNAATLTVLGKTLGRKTLILYLLTIIGGALIAGWLINLSFPDNYFDTYLGHLSGSMTHSDKHSLFSTLSTIVLWTLLLAGLMRKYLLNKPIKKPKIMETDYAYIIKVEGMTCHHCEANVAKNLQNLSGIQEAKADMNNKKVYIKGESINMEEVAKTINSLGYSFVGIEQIEQ